MSQNRPGFNQLTWALATLAIHETVRRKNRLLDTLVQQADSGSPEADLLSARRRNMGMQAQFMGMFNAEDILRSAAEAGIHPDELSLERIEAWARANLDEDETEGVWASAWNSDQNLPQWLIDGKASARSQDG